MAYDAQTQDGAPVGIDARAVAVIKKRNDSRSERANYDSIWQEIAQLYLPSRIDTMMFQGVTQLAGTAGRSGTERLYNAIGVYAVEQLTNALMTYLFNPSLVWMNIRVRNVKDDKLSVQAKNYLTEARDAMMGVLTSDDYGFYPQAHEWLQDNVAIGTACMFVGTNTETDEPHFMTLPMSRIYISESAFGKVNTVYRDFDLTPEQAREFFHELRDEKLPTEGKLKFIHCVEPDVDKGGFSSTHVWEDKQRVLRVGHYKSFPFMVGRWSLVSGEKYGRSEAFTTLPETRMLQQISKLVLKAAQKAVAPSLLIPDNGFLAPIRTAPDSLNIYRNTGKGGKIDQLPMGDLPFGLDLIEAREKIVMRAFFLDMLRSLTLRADKSPLTATETQERVNEGLLAMTPIVVRIQQEFLAPLAFRLYGLMKELNMLPPLPPDLVDRKFRIEFVSPAVLAQKMSDATNLMRWVGMSSQVALLDQSAARVIKGADVVRKIGQVLSVPPELSRTDKELTDMAKAEQQQQAGAQLTESLSKGAGGAVAKLPDILGKAPQQ